MLQAVLRNREGLDATESAVLDEIVAVCDAHSLWGKVSAFSLGSQQELAAAYRHLRARRSVFSLTALYEPFGLAPLEAMAAGLPAAVTRNGGPSESLFDSATSDEYGVLVDPSDPIDIASGLLRLVGPNNQWGEFQKAGRERVLARYTWERTAAGYLSVLEGMQIDRYELFQSREGPIHSLQIPPYFWDPHHGTDLEEESLDAFKQTGD